MVTFIIILIIIGLIAGAVARLLIPGRDPIGLLGTIVLGIVGSFIGGFLQNLIQHHTASIHSFHTVGIIGSIIGAFLLLLVARLPGLGRARGREHTLSPYRLRQRVTRPGRPSFLVPWPTAWRRRCPAISGAVKLHA